MKKEIEFLESLTKLFCDGGAIPDMIGLVEERKNQLKSIQDIEILKERDMLIDKAHMINALTNTMLMNKKELGGFFKLRDNSLEKLNELIKSIKV